MKEFRNTVNRLDRLGYEVRRFDPPIEGELLGSLKRVSDEWLTIPGHRERRFTLGRFDPIYVASTRVYAALDEKGHIVAFLNLIPSYRSGLATVDLMRRRREGINGVIDYLFAKVFLELRTEGFERFSLGMVPGIRADEHPSAVEKVIDWTMRRFPALFRAESLRRFKAKYADAWEPRYTIYRSQWDLPRLALALKKISEDGKELRSAA
jgi:phosphatidylglycerol lysyltransferase